jgi:hypothetical protein
MSGSIRVLGLNLAWLPAIVNHFFVVFASRSSLMSGLYNIIITTALIESHNYSPFMNIRNFWVLGLCHTLFLEPFRIYLFMNNYIPMSYEAI